MIICTLDYHHPIDHDSAVYAEHRAFVLENLAASRFLCAGPRLGAEGGVILLHGCDEVAARRLLDSEPYISKGLAEYHLRSFRVGATDPTNSLAVD